MQHTGSLDDLKTMISGCGFNIQNEKQQQNGWQFRTVEGAIINWYPSTGKLQVQGKPDCKVRFENAWKDYGGQAAESGVSVTVEEAPEPTGPASMNGGNKKVFLVHGHDEVAREQLELVLHKLGLDPFVLANTSGGGLTIIEALEAEIGPNQGAARFGIVLMTPDDMGYAVNSGSDSSQPRARQNVILEMGMLISAVGRGNVAILKKGHLEAPSDAQGILYIPFNHHVKETVPKLSDRLRKAGFVLNPDKIAAASS